MWLEQEEREDYHNFLLEYTVQQHIHKTNEELNKYPCDRQKMLKHILCI